MIRCVRPALKKRNQPGVEARRSAFAGSSPARSIDLLSHPCDDVAVAGQEPNLETVSTDDLLDELVRRFPSIVFAGASEAFAGQDPHVVRHTTRRHGYLVVQSGMLRMMQVRVEEQMLEDARRGGV